MEYNGMPLSWVDYYKTAFEFVRSELGLGITDDDIDRSYEVLKSYNPRINPREYDVSPEVIFSEAIVHWQGDFAISDVIDKFFASINLTAHIYPETLDFLDKLKSKGYKIAALTDIADYFGVIADEMIMIGDEEKDIVGANMEFIFEFILELVLEGGIEVSKSNKIPKYIRYPLIGIIILFFIAVIGFLILTGIILLNENIVLGILLIVIGVLFLIISAIKFRKTYMIKSKKH